MNHLLKYGLVFVIALLVSHISFGQKFGYVDTGYVLEQMPEYKQAKDEVEKLAKDWQQEIADMNKEVEKLEASLLAEEVLLTKEMKADRDKEIQDKWDEVAAYQNQVFGFEGLFFLKKQEVIKPVQDKVFDAVEKVSKKQRLQIMFDKSGDLVMIYTDPVHDYTDYVLEELGLGDKNDVISNN